MGREGQPGSGPGGGARRDPARASMTTPRTIAGQAAISAMRPYIKRALGRTIFDIEREAIAPYLEALREADRVLEEILASGAAEIRPAGDLAQRAEAARRLAMPLLEPPSIDEPE